MSKLTPNTISTVWKDPRFNKDSKIIVQTSPGRSGSTALLKVFAAAGYTSVNQPIKTALRHQRKGTDFRIELPQSVAPIITKETFGFDHIEDCVFNPLEIMINEGGFLPSNIKLVINYRDPLYTLNSWHKFFPRIPFINLEKAYLNNNTIIEYANQHGISVTHYLYELTKGNSIEPILTKLFHQVGLTFTNDALDWDTVPGFDGNFIFIEQPKEYRITNILKQLIKTKHYMYIENQLTHISKDDLKTIASSEIVNTYKNAVKHVESTYGVTVLLSEQFKQLINA